MKKFIKIGLLFFAAIDISITSSGQLCDPFGTGSSINPPFGSGSRTMRICINKCGASTPPELIVFYSRKQDDLTNVTINSTAPYGHGRAAFVKEIAGLFVYDYTFPHSGFTTLNGTSEFKIVEMPSRNLDKSTTTVYYRLGTLAPRSNMLSKTAPTASFPMPDPITIGIVGDSYVAGEGAPLVTARTAGGAVLAGLQTLSGADQALMWNDNDPSTTTDIPCHRSINSGHAQAVAQLRLNNRKIAFAAKFAACSGAKTGDLMSRQQVANGVTVPIQFDVIQNWLTSKGFAGLDILVMGIGGNDVGFADLVFDYMIVPFSDFNNDQDAQRKYTNSSDGRYPWTILSQNYDEVQRVIGTRFNVWEYNVIATGVPSPCKGPIGNPWCGQNELIGNNVGECWGPIEGDDRPAEFEDIHNMIAVKLNQTFQAAATRNKWTFVTMLDRAGNHGLSNCAAPYFNTLGKSQANQGDVLGTVHPNATGYVQMYKNPVLNALQTRVNAINAFWKSFASDCAADAKAAAIAAAKERAKAKAIAANSTASYKEYFQTYQQFRSIKFGTSLDQALLNYKNQISSGSILLPTADINVTITDQLKNISFTDFFQK
ncbi:MAG TPA: hypothetical protein VFZ78_02295 [Flavisolibacter sp.]